MKKVLPSIYKGKVKNNNKNQKQVVLNKIRDNITNVVVNNKENDDININKKIKDIFNSPNYVYKANVSIIMDDGENLKKTIIGRTNNSLITIDDELIDVSKIVQIDFLN